MPFGSWRWHEKQEGASASCSFFFFFFFFTVHQHICATSSWRRFSLKFQSGANLQALCISSIPWKTCVIMPARYKLQLLISLPWLIFKRLELLGIKEDAIHTALPNLSPRLIKVQPGSIFNTGWTQQFWMRKLIYKRLNRLCSSYSRTIKPELGRWAVKVHN